MERGAVWMAVGRCVVGEAGGAIASGSRGAHVDREWVWLLVPRLRYVKRGGAHLGSDLIDRGDGLGVVVDDLAVDREDRVSRVDARPISKCARLDAFDEHATHQM